MTPDTVGHHDVVGVIGNAFISEFFPQDFERCNRGTNVLLNDWLFKGMVRMVSTVTVDGRNGVHDAVMHIFVTLPCFLRRNKKRETLTLAITNNDVNWFDNQDIVWKLIVSTGVGFVHG